MEISPTSTPHSPLHNQLTISSSPLWAKVCHREAMPTPQEIPPTTLLPLAPPTHSVPSSTHHVSLTEVLPIPSSATTILTSATTTIASSCIALPSYHSQAGAMDPHHMSLQPPLPLNPVHPDQLHQKSKSIAPSPLKVPMIIIGLHHRIQAPSTSNPEKYRGPYSWGIPYSTQPNQPASFPEATSITRKSICCTVTCYLLPIQNLNR